MKNDLLINHQIPVSSGRFVYQESFPFFAENIARKLCASEFFYCRQAKNLYVTNMLGEEGFEDLFQEEVIIQVMR